MPIKIFSIGGFLRPLFVAGPSCHSSCMAHGMAHLAMHACARVLISIPHCVAIISHGTWHCAPQCACMCQCTHMLLVVHGRIYAARHSWCMLVAPWHWLCMTHCVRHLHLIESVLSNLPVHFFSMILSSAQHHCSTQEIKRKEARMPHPD